MAATRINVLVYAGSGSTVESVRQCLYTLRRLLAPRYAVITVTGEALIKEPWTASCALLVFPGGADSRYCQTLDGAGNRRIAQYVARGGAYLGFCAGGYYGSKRCEFEVGNKPLEVIGSRELALFPGVCRGCAFSGFVYHSEAGTRAAKVRVNKASFSAGSMPEVFRVYYNGGGVFVDAEKMEENGVEVLASYTEPLSVDGGKGAAAVVYCKVGDGGAILTGPHPEFVAANLDKAAGGPGYAKVVDDLATDDRQRVDFLKACLCKLKLSVSSSQEAIPSLSRIHLSSSKSNGVADLLTLLDDLIITESRRRYIKGENDTFQLEDDSSWSSEPQQGSTALEDEPTDGSQIDYNAICKQVVLHQSNLPACKDTPYFNHHAFYSNLAHYQSQTRLFSPSLGTHLLYGEVVTSTNTLLEKNPTLLSRFPTGLTATATTQIAGRGRGSNIWLSPAGSLIFSTCIRHSLALSQTAPVVFVQYLIAIAAAEGVRSYDPSPGYARLPVKLKWPNDVYAADPAQPDRYVKIGGVLVNSSFSGGDYLLVVGLGLNVSNTQPTTGLNALLQPGVPSFTLEKLLARILTKFEELYEHFCRFGFAGYLQELYARCWLHEGQIVTLETEGGVRARIKGVSTDWGLLVAEELGWEDRPTGRMLQLQSDANSFDFLKGLIRRKG
ncbi:MAG: biotin holocarboxylase synthetase [Vezdaea aestivalis]|nr:MAG: biotin holocarboxylase synthetase [Vezdaea aestivalis]